MYTAANFQEELSKLQDFGPDSLRAMRQQVNDDYYAALDKVVKACIPAATNEAVDMPELAEAVDKAAYAGERYAVWTDFIDDRLD